MGRFLAVLAAVAMIVGAFVYRYGVPGGGGGDDTPGGGDGGGETAVVCAQELGTVCDVLDDVVVEPASVTADRLIAARTSEESAIGGWVAPGPWPAMVDAERARTNRAAIFDKDATPLASAPLVAVMRKGQAPAGCPAEITWKCLGDAAQTAPFRLGGDARTTSTGLFLRAAALAGFFGSPDFATNDLDESPDARPWFDNLNRNLDSAAQFGARSLPDFIAQQGSANAFVTGGQSAAIVGGGNVSFDVRTPTPAVTISVAYTRAVRNGRDVDVGPLRDPLRDAGWQVQSPAKTQGLPSPGVLLALRTS